MVQTNLISVEYVLGVCEGSTCTHCGGTSGAGGHLTGCLHNRSNVAGKEKFCSPLVAVASSTRVLRWKTSSRHAAAFYIVTSRRVEGGKCLWGETKITNVGT